MPLNGKLLNFREEAIVFLAQVPPAVAIESHGSRRASATRCLDGHEPIAKLARRHGDTSDSIRNLLVCRHARHATRRRHCRRMDHRRPHRA